MKLNFIEINGKALQVSDLEYLYTYTNNNGEKIAVFEYDGQKIEKKVIDNDSN